MNDSQMRQTKKRILLYAGCTDEAADQLLNACVCSDEDAKELWKKTTGKDDISDEMIGVAKRRYEHHAWEYLLKKLGTSEEDYLNHLLNRAN